MDSAISPCSRHIMCHLIESVDISSEKKLAQLGARSLQIGDNAIIIKVFAVVFAFKKIIVVVIIIIIVCSLSQYSVSFV